MENSSQEAENEMTLEGFNGAILKDDPRDWKLGADNLDIQIEPNLFPETHEYNQLEFKNTYGSNLCTVYAPIGCIADLFGRNIEESEREELVKIRYNMEDFNPLVGGYLVEGNNCVRRWWNAKFPNNKVRQFAIDKNSDKFMEALYQGYRINIGYRGNQTYNQDASDGVLDSVEIGNTTYGHSTTCKFLDGEVIVDSYEGIKKHNIYSIKEFEKFLKSDIVFQTAYLFLREKTMTQDEKDLIEAKTEGIWNGERATETVTRAEAVLMIKRALREYEEA